MYLLSILSLLILFFIFDLYLTIVRQLPENFVFLPIYVISTSLMLQMAYNDSLIAVISQQKFYIVFTILLFFSLFCFYRGLFKPLLSRFLYLVTSIVIALGFFIKFTILDQPLVWNDLKNGLVVDVLWNMVIKAHWLLFGFFFICFLGIIWLTLREGKISTLKIRVTFISLALFALLLSFNFEKKALAALQKNNSDVELQKIEGPLLYFFSTKDDEFMTMPADYSKQRMAEIVTNLTAKYPQITGKKANQPSIIYILSEAFTDPMIYENSEWLADPMPTIRELQTENGGHLLVNNFGNGTANTEFSIITNFSFNFFKKNTIPYNYLYELPEANWRNNLSVVSLLNQQGYRTTALHTHLKKGYHRDVIFDKFNFDQALFREDMNENNTEFFFYDESYLSDRTLFSYISNQFKDSQQPQFIHALSMQNHYPYSDKQPITKQENLLENSDTLPGGDELAIFARGIQKTDLALKELLVELESYEQEINLVFYGDHLPSLTKKLYNNSHLTHYKDQQLAKYATPYFIWNNRGKKLTTPALVTPELLTSNLLAQTALELPIFHRFTADLTKSIEAFDKQRQTYYKDNQAISLSSAAEKMLADYELLQYDHLFGYDYAKELFE